MKTSVHSLLVIEYIDINLFYKLSRGWEQSWVGQYLPGMHKAWGLIPNYSKNCGPLHNSNLSVCSNLQNIVHNLSG